MSGQCIIEAAPHRLDYEHQQLFSSDALQYLTDLVAEFEIRVRHLLLNRIQRKSLISQGKWKVEFTNNSSDDLDWRIAQLPERLKSRKLDLGDVSPANSVHFKDALYSDVCGVQVRIRKYFVFRFRFIVRVQRIGFFCSFCLPIY